jgi:O-6-methylguanine DNA methyltransferase
MISLYAKNIEGVWFGVACDEKKVFSTNFGFNEKSVLQGLLSSIPFDVSFQQTEKASALSENVIATLKDIYDGKDAVTSFPLSMEHLSDYARKVLPVASLIPVGYASSYGYVAKAAGGGPRAVGNVMASNPFAPIVPCHRVVSSDFTLGGYGGGYGESLKVKRAFLEREKRGYASNREISVKGKKLHVFPVEFVLRKVKN